MADKKFRQHQEELKELCLLLEKLDVICGVLNFRQMNKGDWCKPKFHAETAIEVQSLIHPLIQ